MKVKSDHRSKFSNLSNWERRSLKKIRASNGIRTRDLRDAGAMLYQLRYEATHWERGQFIEFISSRAVKWCWSPDFFQASSFQLLKLENLLRWSLFAFLLKKFLGSWFCQSNVLFNCISFFYFFVKIDFIWLLSTFLTIKTKSVNTTSCKAFNVIFIISNYIQSINRKCFVFNYLIYSS